MVKRDRSIIKNAIPPKKNKVNESDSDSDESFDSSLVSSDESLVDETAPEPQETEEQEEEEDELIAAIKRECTKKNNHPPNIDLTEPATDISFHPVNDILAVSTYIGDVLLYKYSNDENQLISTLELHSDSCRDIEFSQDGKLLFSSSSDKTVMISDVETEKLVSFYEKCHNAAVNCVTLIDENQFATGDDDGVIKLWDRRRKGDQPIYKSQKNENIINAMVTNEACNYLVCASGDGTITTIDLVNRGVHMRTEEYEEEFNCLGLFRTETKLLAGTNKGKLYLYNWNEFAYHSDAVPAPKPNPSINGMVPVTENITITACDDGVLRATHLFPHRPLGIVGQHELGVEKVDICNNGQFIASSAHDSKIKFWNIQYFEDFEKVSNKHKKHQTKKELAHNLPSSKMKNASDFFSDLV